MDGKRRNNLIDVRICTVAAVLAILSLTGCQTLTAPRLRIGSYWGSPTPMSFPDPMNLGHHHYRFGIGEKTGMVYTCKAGFIDLGHVREAADRTAYLAGVTYSNIMNGNTTFSFRVVEPSRYWVSLEYPPDWDQLPEQQKETVATDLSIEMAQYFAHTSLIWHEILTWYGFSSTGLFKEYISAFSWEDTYSDLLGTTLGARALRDDTHSYDDAVTSLLTESLLDLDALPPSEARRAAKKVEGDWFSGGFYVLVEMKKRNFDVGYNNGYITPWLVDGICDSEPATCPVPSLESLCNNGFTMQLEIEPREWEKGKIYKDLHASVGRNRIRPDTDFPQILRLLKETTVASR